MTGPRGVFINHTPRTHESLRHERTLSEDLIRLYSYYGSSIDDLIANSIITTTVNSRSKVAANGKTQGTNESWHTPITVAKATNRVPQSFAQRFLQRSALALDTDRDENPSTVISQGLADSRPMDESVYYHKGAQDPRKSTATSSQVSVRSKSSTKTKCSVRPATEQVRYFPKLSALAHLKPTKVNGTSKRGRRRTPFEFEPLVKLHRRHVTSSNAEPLPPQINFSEFDEPDNSITIREYFDSLEDYPFERATREVIDESNSIECRIPYTPLPASLTPGSYREHDYSCLSKTLKEDEESILNFSERDPEQFREQISPLNALHPVRSTSDIFIQSVFASTARPPNDQESSSMTTSEAHASTPEPATERATSTSSSRIAPPILNHEEMMVNGRLNDFNYFLRNDRPHSIVDNERGSKSKVKKGLQTMKIRSKRVSNKPTNTIGDPPSVSPPSLPACAREMTTASGVKHLQIIIPTHECLPDHPLALPIHDAEGRSRQVSVQLIDETSQSYDDLSAGDTFPSTYTADSSSAVDPELPSTLKPNQILGKAIIQENQVRFALRKETTRMRKLRDLEKAKSKAMKMPVGLDAVEEASLGTGDTSQPTGVKVDNEAPCNQDRKESLEGEAAHLERVAEALAEALARVMGIDFRGSGLNPEELLRRYWSMRGESDHSEICL